MNREDFLKQIAQMGYDVGFGAKKHFASFDMIEKIPGIISFISISIGILSLFIVELTIKHISATLLILGIIGIYISVYNTNKNNYCDTGTKLTSLYQELKELYFIVKGKENNSFDTELQKFQDIKNRFYENNISKQVLFSDWYTHYKFFWQHQIDWIDNELKFKFWRDKIPLSLSIIFILILCVFGYLVSDYVITSFDCLNNCFKGQL